MLYNKAIFSILFSLAIIGIVDSETHLRTRKRRRLLQMPRVDIPILMDESGSMDGFQDAFQDNVDSLFTAMEAQMAGSRVGLVGFGASHEGIHTTQAHVHQRLTDDMALFQLAANDLIADGGREPSCEALIKVLEGKDDELDVDMREDNEFCVVLITDEKSNHDDKNYTEARAVAALQGNNTANAKGFFFGIVPKGPVMDSFKPLVDATGGHLFDQDDFINSPASVLEHLVTKCNVAVNKITIDPLTSQLEIGQEHELTIRAIKEANGLPIGDSGRKITVKVVSGPDVGVADVEVTTNNLGEAFYKLTSEKPGTNVFVACQANVCAKKAQAEWTSKGTKITLTPPSDVRNMNATFELTATLTLGSGSPGGKSVTFNVTSGPHSDKSGNQITDDAGVAQWSFKGTQTGTDEVKACYGTYCDTSTVEWQYPANVWLNPASASCPVGEPHILRATVNRPTGIAGKPDPLVGTTVTFRVIEGPNTGLVLPPNVTDSNGEAFSQCTGNSTGVNKFEACIVDNDEDICSTSEVIWASDGTKIELSPASDVRNINATFALTATVTLRSGSPGGKSVTFNVTSGPHSNKSSNQITDNAGVAQWSFKGTQTGTDEVKACYGTYCDTSTVEWQYPANVWLNPASASCPVGEPHILRATVNRPTGIEGKADPLMGTTVTFRVIEGPNTGLVLPANVTDSNGEAFSQCTGNSTGVNKFEACIVDNGEDICSTSEVIWASDGTKIELSPASDVRNINATFELTATVTLRSGSPGGKSVTFNVTSGPHSNKSSNQITDNAGVAQWSFKGTQTGTDEVKACYGTYCDTSTVEWQYPANVWLNPASASCPVGEPHILRATVNRPTGIEGKADPLVGTTVTFRVIEGPNTGLVLPANVTDSNGEAFSQCTGNSTGVNKFEACIVDNDEDICSTSEVIWASDGTKIELSPASDVRNINATFALTATVTLRSGSPGGKSVTFNVTSGPHSNKSSNQITDNAGVAQWSFKGTQTGTDEVKACYGTYCDTSTVEWQYPANVWLNPASASCPVGEPHILRATVNRPTGIEGKADPLMGTTVTFRVIEGPNTGLVLPANVTDSNGEAFSQCTGNSTGVNKFEACIVDNGEDICSTSEVIWASDGTKIELSPASDVRNINATFELTATVTLRSGSPGGKSVTFNVTSGPHSNKSSNQITDNAGVAQWSFKGTQTGTDEVKACYGTYCDTSTVEWQYPANVWLNPASASCPVGEPHILRATVNRPTGIEGKADPLVGTTVTFRVIEGPNTGLVLPANVTDSNGEAFSQCTGNSTGVNKFEACIVDNGEDICSTSEVIWASDGTKIELSPASDVRNINATFELTATVTLRSGSPGGKSVTFNVTSGPHSNKSSNQITDNAGVAQWSFKGTQTGTDEVKACYGTYCDTSTVEWQYPANVWLNPASASCPVGEPHILRATVNRPTGIEGKADPLMGTTVTFRVIEGPNTGLVLPANVTDSNGEAFSQCTGNSTGVNKFEACIVDNGEDICSTSEVIWASDGTKIELSPASDVRNINATFELTATVTLRSGSPGGKSVTFNVTSGPHSNKSSNQITDNAGVAQWSFKGTQTGTDEVKACYGTYCDTSTVEWQYPANVWLNPASASCPVGEPHILRATVNRPTGIEGKADPLVGTTVTFRVIEGPNTGLVLPANVTDSNGEAFSQCTGNSTGVNKFEACIVDNGEDICSTSEVIWASDGTKIELSPASDVRNINATFELTATVTLRSGSPGGKSVTFNVTSGPHSNKSSNQITDNAGVAQWSFKGTQTGTDEVKACYGTYCDTSTVEWQYPANVWLNPASASCPVGEPHILRATVNRPTGIAGKPDPLVGTTVTFRVIEGPNTGLVLPPNVTDSNGEAFSQCTGNSTGVNKFEACIVDNGEDICSTSEVIWASDGTKIELSPASDVRNINATFELTATVTLRSGSPGGKSVTFNVTSGPHSNKSSNQITDFAGVAQWSFKGTQTGTDEVKVCYGTYCDTSTVEWQYPANVWLNPASASCPVGEPHILRATVNRPTGIAGKADPLVGTTVTFRVIEGPNTGLVLPPNVTDSNGEAFSQCTGNSTGVNKFEACIVDNGEDICSTSEVIWASDGTKIELSPASDVRNINATFELTATVTLRSGSPGGKSVTFNVTSGPHSNKSGNQITDNAGFAKWSFKGTQTGTDEVKACYGTYCDTSTVEWQYPANVWLNPASASCPIGEPHILRATVNRPTGIVGRADPLVGKMVTFKVIQGPNSGTELESAVTDSNGDAFSQCTSDSSGLNVFEACVVDNGEDICSTSEAVWALRVAPTPATDGPTARCRDITRNALGDCKASVRAADIDDGSSDPIDSASDLTLALNDTSPFSLGDTTVKLFVTNKAGRQASCNARIRVVDIAAPVINCNSPGSSAVSFATETTFRSTASDNCPGSVRVNVVGEKCFRVVGSTRAYKSPKCTVTLSGPSITISPECKAPDHVEWEVEAKDTAGNVQTKTCALVFEGSRRKLDSPSRRYLRGDS